MKAGKTLEQLAQELTAQNATKRDFIAPTNKIVMSIESDAPKLSLDGVGSMELNEIAHGQVGEFTGIPAKYYDRLLTSSPELLAENVNHWMERSEGQRLVRTLNGKARAFLSNSYRRLDNMDLAEVVLPALIESKCRVESCEVTDKRMYIKAVSTEIRHEVKKGDIVEAGIIISNSEVGYGALSIEPLLYRLVCENGLIVNEARHRKAHLGNRNESFEGVTEFFTNETKQADDRAYFMKVRDFMRGMFSTFGFEGFVQKFSATLKEEIVGEPEKVVEVVQQRLGLLESERSSVLIHLLQGGELNKFGLINAITRAAQDVPSFDRSVELERLGGAVMELPKKDWELISTGVKK